MTHTEWKSCRSISLTDANLWQCLLGRTGIVGWSRGESWLQLVTFIKSQNLVPTWWFPHPPKLSSTGIIILDENEHVGNHQLEHSWEAGGFGKVLIWGRSDFAALKTSKGNFQNWPCQKPVANVPKKRLLSGEPNSWDYDCPQ